MLYLRTHHNEKHWHLPSSTMLQKRKRNFRHAHCEGKVKYDFRSFSSSSTTKLLKVSNVRGEAPHLSLTLTSTPVETRVLTSDMWPFSTAACSTVLPWWPLTCAQLCSCADTEWMNLSICTDVTCLLCIPHYFYQAVKNVLELSINLLNVTSTQVFILGVTFILCILKRIKGLFSLCQLHCLTHFWLVFV